MNENNNQPLGTNTQNNEPQISQQLNGQPQPPIQMAANQSQAASVGLNTNQPIQQPQQPMPAPQQSQPQPNQFPSGSSIYDLKGGGLEGIISGKAKFGIIGFTVSIVGLLFSFYMSYDGGKIISEGYGGYFVKSGILIFISLIGLVLGTINQKDKENSSIFGLISLVLSLVILYSASTSAISIYRLYSETSKYDSYNSRNIE